MNLKRALGCFYGQLIGDAFGCRYEFKDAKTTSSMMDSDANENGFIPLLGGGPFQMSPGQVGCFSTFLVLGTEKVLRQNPPPLFSTPRI